MSLLRDRAGGHARVSYAELLFDLVFVFAVTQLSHALLADLSVGGVLRTVVLFLGVWWVWIYTAWVTNWLDPDRHGVRLMLFALMAAGLVMSIAIPHAYAETGLLFALAYVAMQVGRSVFMWNTLRRPSPDNAMNFARISAWQALSGVFWLAGALAPPVWRSPLWLAAIGIEYVSPLLAFRVPGLGRPVTSTWDVESGHLSERCALFMIIAFGEVILMTGATFAGHAHEMPAILAFAAAFAAALAMWWLYFAAAAERAGARFAAAADVGAVARSAYTYLHLPIVGGVIAFAAGVEHLIAHPTGHVEGPTAALLGGGPLLYLAGLAGFRLATGVGTTLAHWVAMAALALLVVVAGLLPPLGLAGAVTIVLVVLAAVESRAEDCLAKGSAHA